MAKIKEVEIDGEKFKIGKFNCLQVEEMVGRPPTEDTDTLIGHMWSTIATALYNGSDPLMASAENYKPIGEMLPGGRDLMIAVSPEQRNDLHREVLEFNGLRVKPAGESQGTGAQ